MAGMDLTDFPSRNPEGWAVIEHEHGRSVGRVQIVRVGDVAMLEIDQPEIRAGHYRGNPIPKPDPATLVLSPHKTLLSLRTVQEIIPVPSEDHCIAAYFECAPSGPFGLGRCPELWAPQSDSTS